MWKAEALCRFLRDGTAQRIATTAESLILIGHPRWPEAGPRLLAGGQGRVTETDVSSLVAGVRRLAMELADPAGIETGLPVGEPLLLPSAQARSAAAALARAVDHVAAVKRLQGAGPGEADGALQGAAIRHSAQLGVEALREAASILTSGLASGSGQAGHALVDDALPVILSPEAFEPSLPAVALNGPLEMPEPAASPAPHADSAIRLLEEAHILDGGPIVIAGRYEVLDIISHGALGVVVAAHDQRRERRVALKLIRIASALDDVEADMLERFRQEERIVTSLSHPGIVQVHDFGNGPGHVWIAMELVHGESLKAALDAGQRFSPAAAARLAIEVLEALDYAHAHGVVHRDVKSGNILLAADRRGGHPHARLVDFGISRLGDTGLVSAGQMIGTLTTMSPEQLRGEAVDARTDIWSTGVVLYRLLTGQRPFEGHASAVISGIMARDPALPSSLAPELPPGFDMVILTALAKPVDQRFASARAFIDALRPLAIRAGYGSGGPG